MTLLTGLAAPLPHLAVCQADLREAFLKRMQPQTCISRGAARSLRRGQPPAVQVSGERRQGNKFITRVVGVEAFL